MSENTEATSFDALSETVETHSNVNSFDEIETMTMDKSAEELVKEASKHVKEEAKSEGSSQKVDNTAHAAEPKAKEEVSDADAKQDAAELNESETQELIEEIKMLSAKRGENDYEIPVDAKLTVKIDGEETEVSIEELRNNYSGKTAWDKKFTELSKEKATLKQETQQIEAYVNQFRDLAEKKDYSGALEFLAELAGQNPLQFRRNLRDSFYEQFKQLQEMTPEQIDAFEISEENEFLKRQNESEKQRLSSQQTQLELERKVAEFQDTHGLSYEELVNLYDETSQSFANEGKGEPGLSDLESTLYNRRASSASRQILEELDSSLLSDSKIVSEATELVKKYGHEWSKEDFIEVFREGFGIAPKKTVASKAKKAAKSTEKTETKSQPKHQAITFDDLLDF